MRVPTKKEMEEQKAIKYIPSLGEVYVNRVIDGDSIECYAYCESSKNIYKYNVRVYGVDTPEMRSRDPEEKKAARAAKEVVKQACEKSIVYLSDVSYDKFGRILARVLMEGGKSLDKLIIESKHGIEYFGGKKSKFKAT